MSQTRRVSTVALPEIGASGHTYPHYRPRLVLVERVFTQTELKRYNGERGERAYLAYAGVVYDVTDCPKWRTGLHEQLHFAGFDLTSELPDAPHGQEVFSRPCVRRAGVLRL